MTNVPMTMGLVSEDKKKSRKDADRFSHATAVRVVAKCAEKAGFKNAQYADIDVTFSKSGAKPEIDYVTRGEGKNFLVKFRLHNWPADTPLSVFADAMSSLFHHLKGTPYKVGPEFKSWVKRGRL